MEMNKNLFLFFLFCPKQNEKNPQKHPHPSLSFFLFLFLCLHGIVLVSIFYLICGCCIFLVPSIPPTPSRPSPRVATTLLPVAALLLLQKQNKTNPFRLN